MGARQETAEGDEQKLSEKTIAAIATSVTSSAGIGVVRISGENALEIADRVFKSVSGKPVSEMAGYSAAFGKVYAKNEVLDEAVCLVFRAPKSYTGEDVAEISVHGGIYIQKTLLRELFANGAQPAAPGEFTKRAFLNGKLDLAEAESVAAIIEADGERALRASLCAKEGAVSKKIGEIKEILLNAASSLAAFVDYPDEEPEFSGIDKLEERLRLVQSELTKLIKNYDAGRVFREGVSTAIVGRPNVGKSTLMNMLSGCDRSIVTSIGGTTRDVIEESVRLGGIKLRLSDTAGIRETDDPVEKIGVERSQKCLQNAELVLAVFDSSMPLSEDDREIIKKISGKKAVAVLNKSDLPRAISEKDIENLGLVCVPMSAKNGLGAEELENAVRRAVTDGNFDDGVLLSSERQRMCAQKAAELTENALKVFKDGVTLDAVGVLIDDALSSLLELTGERVTTAVTDEVFKNFCVGK